MSAKLCRFCGRVLPLTAFSRRAKSYDGVQNKCKQCTSLYMHGYGQKIKMRRAEYMREYYELHQDELRASSRIRSRQRKIRRKLKIIAIARRSADGRRA